MGTHRTAPKMPKYLKTLRKSKGSWWRTNSPASACHQGEARRCLAPLLQGPEQGWPGKSAYTFITVVYFYKILIKGKILTEEN